MQHKAHLQVLQMATKKVLIVEDEMILSLMLEQMVTQMGHTIVDKVTTGEMAVQRAIDAQPDIILMDIRLQGKMDGIEAITQIQEKMDVSVIYITGNTDRMYRRRVDETKYLDFLVKPITQHQLSHSLHRAS